MRLVAPFGFYGAGNIGDEATLKGFAQLLAETGIPVQVSVGSRNPSHTACVEPAFRYFHAISRDLRRWLAMKRGSAHAVIGGTPIMDIDGDWPLSELTPLVQLIDRLNVPLAFIGVGTETLRREQSRRTVREEFAPRVLHWSVRCERDRQRLTDCGAPPGAITVAADLAWLMEPSTEDFGRQCLAQWVGDRQALIGVNLVNEMGLLDQPGLVADIALALDQLATDLDSRIVFLANEVRPDSQFDRAAALRIISLMKSKERVFLAPNQYFTPAQMMSIIACCDLTISMRYHFCMFSALQGVPFIAIERSDKVTDLCWDIGWSAAVAPSKLDPIEVIEHGRRLRQNTPGLRKQLDQCVQEMRRRAGRNAEALKTLVRHCDGVARHGTLAAS